MKMPDALQVALLMGASLGDAEQVAAELRDFQRDTLRAAAEQFAHKASSIPMSQGCAKTCPVCNLNALADSLAGTQERTKP